MKAGRIIAALAWTVAFALIGAAVAAVGELQYSVLIRGDWSNFAGSIGFNLMYLTLWAAAVGLLMRFLHKGAPTVVVVTALAGFVGLMIEWFVIGNSPWGNPDASNVGMFAYWACMVMVPIALLDTEPSTRRTRRNILLFGLFYTLLALAVELIPNETIRYVYHIWSVVLGYLGLLALTVVGLLRGWQQQSAATSLAS